MGAGLSMKLRAVTDRIARLWRGFRAVVGDDAYERYLAHWRAHHAHEGAPLDRRGFYLDEQRRRWSGVRRCC
jgi:uncharacterized short protein YbdD (DUF466 family)